MNGWECGLLHSLMKDQLVLIAIGPRTLKLGRNKYIRTVKDVFLSRVRTITLVRPNQGSGVYKYGMQSVKLVPT